MYTEREREQMIKYKMVRYNDSSWKDIDITAAEQREREGHHGWLVGWLHPTELDTPSQPVGRVQ